MATIPLPPDPLIFDITDQQVGQRLDTFLAQQLEISRSHLQQLITQGHVLVNQEVVKKSHLLEQDDQITVSLTAPAPIDLEPCPVAFDILYEADEFLVINKPPDLSVHPAPGQKMTTLVHGLLARFPELSDAAGPYRPGIVHRLDRFTSGVLLVAKTNRAHQNLAQQFAQRTVHKEYRALVEGLVEFDQNLVEAPIARHSQHRQRMQVSLQGKAAKTRIDVISRFRRQTYVKCFPHTGRRHQIRVHCLHLRHKILGDTLYGGRLPVTLHDLTGESENDHAILNRLALHAYEISFQHPLDQQPLTFQAPLLPDFQNTLKILKSSSQ